MEPLVANLRIYRIGVLLLLVVFVGCTASPRSTDTSTVVSSKDVFTPSPTAVISPAPTIHTMAPNSVAPTPIVLPIRTASPSLTPAPTFTSDERQTLIKEMLKTNGGCDLPCWWGVVPGQTDWQTLLNRFIVYGGFSFDIPPSIQSFEYLVDLDFNHRDGIVQSTHVASEVHRGIRSAMFFQDWQHYSLDQMLTRYGPPSRVQIELTNVCLESGCGPAPYNLFVFYDHLGILVRYQGPAIRGDPIRACPAFDQLEYLELWLQSPEQTNSILQTANLDASELSHMRPLTETTGISLEQFYETFKDPKNQKCLESPAKYWP